MVTELKINNVEGNFLQEMHALVQEDERVSGAAVKKAIADPAEWAQRLAGKSPGVAPPKKREMGLAKDADIDFHKALAEQMGMEFVHLNDFPPTDFKVLRMVPFETAKVYIAFPLSYSESEDNLVLAISDPSNPTIVDDLSLLLGCGITPLLATEADIIERISDQYGLGSDSIDTFLEEFAHETQEDILAVQGDDVIDLSDVSAMVSAPAIIRLTSMVLMRAIQEHSSDIHIEPFENLLRIRYRVDGMLREMPSPHKDMQLGLVSRLKVMANLDIAETRRPQSGRIRLTLPQGRNVDLRMETMPTVHGEAITMRVLDQTMMQLGIQQIGMSQDVLKGFLREIRKPNGVVLVVGPTGCGKTTTLYAAMNEVKSPEDKIITTEDPVEYQLEGLVQIGINESVGLTFAACLRSILRQDPDKILVGEIRDLETAQISVQAALTGHLVFSTLHTNSASGTITRLIDMGIEPFLITSTLQAVVGQRLVRTICANCAEPYTPIPEDLIDFGLTPADIVDMSFYHGAGCEDCAFTGYRGRVGLFEFLLVTDEICDLVLEHATTDDIHDMAVKQGMVSLRQDGWNKICSGITTFSEVSARAPREGGAVTLSGQSPAGGEGSNALDGGEPPSLSG